MAATQNPPLLIIDDTHRGAEIAIAASLGLSMILVSFLIRLFVRIYINPPFGRDDVALLAATVFAIVQVSIVYAMISRGYGNSIELISRSDITFIDRCQIASDIIFVVVLYLSKICVAFTYIRLTPNEKHNRYSWIFIIFCSLWVLASVLMLAVPCSDPLLGNPVHCTNMLYRWKVIISFNIVTEFLLLALAVYLVLGLRMSVQSKVIVVVTFGLRLVVVAFAASRIKPKSDKMRSDNYTFDGVSSAIWTQVEMHYSIIACTIYCLKPFVTAVSSNYGTANDANIETTLGYFRGQSNDTSKISRSHGSFSLASFIRGLRDTKSPYQIDDSQSSDGMVERGERLVSGGNQNIDLGPLRPDTVNHRSSITRDRKPVGSSIGSSDGTRITKYFGFDINFRNALRRAGG